MNWLTRLFSTKAPAKPTPPVQVAAAGPAAMVVAEPSAAPPDVAPALLPWLLGCAPAGIGTGLTRADRSRVLDDVLAVELETGLVFGPLFGLLPVAHRVPCAHDRRVFTGAPVRRS